MRPRSQARRVLKWAGTAMCVAIAVAWVLSYSGYVVGHFQPTGSTLLYDGRIRQPRDGRLPASLRGQEGWHVFRPGGMIPTLDDVSIPLWLPTLLVCVPTGLMWWRDAVLWWGNRRRLPSGHCTQCGYDLTGNVSGRCPECGERV